MTIKDLKFVRIQRGTFNCRIIVTSSELEEIREIEARSTEAEEFPDKEDDKNHRDIWIRGLARRQCYDMLMDI